jgi:hypothetical protein
MSLLLFAAAIASGASTPPPVTITPRAQWRLCTRQSAIEQLKARRLSIEHESIVQKAFADCSEQMKAVSRTQSPDDIRRLEDEQRKFIQMDVEVFYWDNKTGHI